MGLRIENSSKRQLKRDSTLNEATWPQGREREWLSEWETERDRQGETERETQRDRERQRDGEVETEIRRRRGGINLIETKCFYQEIAARSEGPEHRYDLRDDEREMDELLVLFVSSLLHAAVATDKVDSFWCFSLWLLRWESGAEEGAEEVDVGPMKKIPCGVNARDEMEKFGRLLWLYTIALPLSLPLFLLWGDDCVRRIMKMAEIPIARGASWKE
jgi:hypothetical protein